MWLKPKICRKSLFHANEVAGYNKSVEGSILLIKNIEKINSRSYSKWRNKTSTQRPTSARTESRAEAS
ncbi:hypothetical protein SFRURICE_007030 [Spodoptera frugiperda]|nr:hypothetical protein SFRURICE_007030 [Spodoptera frugiperda]